MPISRYREVYGGFAAEYWLTNPRSRAAGKALRACLSAMLALGICGCVTLEDQPELHPDKFSPASVDRQWTPAPAVTSEYALPARATARQVAPSPANAQEYDLAALIDVALRNNPQTRAAWQSSRAAAANYGASRAPYYPLVTAESDNGFVHSMFELPGTVGILKQWEVDPVVSMTYTLLDFGRRRSSAEVARNQLIAANFAFNRALQSVVFNTQNAFYSLDAAQAAVIAAQQNLELAQTDFEAVSERVNLGLATAPELLLAKERVAQSRFDLANAHLLVHDAQAQLAVALGVPANAVMKVQGLENQHVPESLNTEVDQLIAQARRERPDLAAQVANVQASDAEVERAQAEFYPTIGLSAAYGENIWNFTLHSPRTVNNAIPEYSALMVLKWDIFTGFKRINDVRAAEANRNVARAQLDTLEIGTVADVWRAYFEFQSSRSKYDFADSLVAASQEAYDANLETYRNGLSTIIELLTAERDLANARYTLIQSKAQLLTAYAAVAYAAGAVRIPR
jgi:outer membrane protein